MGQQDDNGNPSNLKVALVALMFVGTILALFSLWFHGCAVGPKEAATQSPPPATDGQNPPPPPPGCDDGKTPYGATRSAGCPAGQLGSIVSACTDKGWQDINNTCHVPPADKPDCGAVVTFDELAPVIGLNCVGCHAGRDQYAQAKEKNQAMIVRIKRGLDEAGHMPAGRPSLAARDVALFEKWAADGYLAAGDCKPGVPVPGQEFIDFATVEQTMFADGNKQPTADRVDTHWLIAVDQLNANNLDALPVARAAANKGVNSVSVDRTIRPVVAVAPGIWRINTRDLGIEAPDWKAIEDASQLQLESFTQTGLALKAMTKTRLPWMFVQDFNDTTLRNAAVYYRLTEAPATLQLLTAKLGVNFAVDLANFKAALVGFNGSPLSPAANRLMSRHQSSDGAFWATYDTGAIVSAAQNVFKNPLLAEAGGKANLKFAAGEQLYTLPNGLMASFLADAAGKRLNQADPAVVHDFTTNPVAPIIKNAVSCFRCHSGGLIHAVDQVRAAIPASGIGADDTQRALALFKTQPEVDRLFAGDNARFAQAMAQLGLDPTQPDPISKVSDAFLGDLGAAAVGGLLFLRPDELKQCINLSADGKQQAGQLLSGGSIGHDQLVQVLPALKSDCRLFQDPLNQ